MLKINRYVWLTLCTLMFIVTVVEIWFDRPSAYRERPTDPIIVIAGDGKQGNSLARLGPTSPSSPVRIDPTTTSYNNDTAALAELVHQERRDVVWADRSERVIRDALTIGMSAGRLQSIDVKCAMTVCEVAGIVESRVSQQDLRETWEELRRRQTGAVIVQNNLRAVASTYGSGRNLYSVNLYFRRNQPYR